MRDFALRRFVRLLVVVFGVSFFSFILVHLSGDPALMMLPPEAPPREVAEFKRVMGFDQPLPVQYWRFVTKAVTGDFGKSLKHQRPATDIVLERLPYTVKLATAAMAVGVALAIPLGILSAVKRKTTLDSVIGAAAVAGNSIPVFWTGILMIMFFGVKLGWLPVSGWGTWKHVIMPATALGLFSAPVMVRLVRSSMIDVLSQDYIRTARAKGLAERVVVYKHALKNAAIPVVTVMGIQFGRLLGGSVITESVFAVPGLGRAVIQAISFADFPLVQAAVLVLSLIVVGLNFVVDMLYGYLNPQVRYS